MKSISKIRKIAAVAAILVLALTLASCGANKPAGGDTNTDGTASTTEKTPDDPAPEFEIEDGVLVSYRGSDEIVTVPDSVTEIAAGAFEASPNVKGITTVKIGANVKKIADTAFSRMTGLRSFEIAEGNKNYTVISDVAVNRDGSQCFFVPMNVSSRVSEFSLDAERRKITLGDTKSNGDIRTRYLISGAVIEVESDTGAGNRDEDYSFVMKSISFRGKKLEFGAGTPKKLSDLQYASIAISDDCFAFTDRPSALHMYGYVFGPDEIASIDTFALSRDELCGESIYQFYPGDDGSMRYVRTAWKYHDMQTPDNLFRYCVARDELYSERGTVVFDGPKLVFVPESSKTVSDTCDLDEAFGMTAYARDFANLDDYLAENAKKYARAY